MMRESPNSRQTEPRKYPKCPTILLEAYDGCASDDEEASDAGAGSESPGTKEADFPPPGRIPRPTPGSSRPKTAAKSAFYPRDTLLLHTGMVWNRR